MMTVIILVRIKGGAGSGNWGHAGRPGLRGGSASTSGGTSATAALTSAQRRAVTGMSDQVGHEMLQDAVAHRDASLINLSDMVTEVRNRLSVRAEENFAVLSDPKHVDAVTSIAEPVHGKFMAEFGRRGLVELVSQTLEERFGRTGTISKTY